MKRAGDWRVATPPAAYGSVDDGATCRHVRVARAGLTLEKLKSAILDAYENQYCPEQIKLFTRVYDDDVRQVRERGVLKAVSYDPDWADLQLGDATDLNRQARRLGETFVALGERAALGARGGGE